MDTIWALVIPGALPVYNTILLMNFFRNLPKEIKESAMLDGITPFQMMMRIFVPLAKPAIAHCDRIFRGVPTGTTSSMAFC